eukprot:TRINITY_DN2208_c3_g1_i2.p1 TRINITY_DN2208_c3_g1~~TRINITY_DN2208_c3_g1_i2.p1  ORF type:complete len:592 (+),score=182.54 TRINITY_DN2208_c3_g1_i2:25-1800(+)
MEQVGEVDEIICVECEDVPASVLCSICEDHYCGLCFQWLHKRGKRAGHKTNAVNEHLKEKKNIKIDYVKRGEEVEGTTEYFMKQLEEKKNEFEKKDDVITLNEIEVKTNNNNDDDEDIEIKHDEDVQINDEYDKYGQSDDSDDDDDDIFSFSPFSMKFFNRNRYKKRYYMDDVYTNRNSMFTRNSKYYKNMDKKDEKYDPNKDGVALQEHANYGKDLLKRCSYIPLRISFEERQLLLLIEGALEISEYTDNVDVSSDYFGWRTEYYSKDETIQRELNESFALVLGLFISTNLRKGTRLINKKNFEQNKEFLQKVFEIARRFKIVNPDKMRTTYGKLMFMVQDSLENLNFSIKIPIRTVATLVNEINEREKQEDSQNIIDILLDPLLAQATLHIEQGLKNIEELVEAKKESRATLIKTYGSPLYNTTVTEVEMIIDSIADSNSYIVQNRNPVDKMLFYLENIFDKNQPEEGYSLAIQAGKGGSKLSHKHSTQYEFVKQSLLLWREIQHEMFQLWIKADKDLLNERCAYRLRNTGQGLNRVQAAPHISSAMSSILGRVQARLGNWVGLSVVHLGFLILFFSIPLNIHCLLLCL